jgi:hypothetical protein
MLPRACERWVWQPSAGSPRNHEGSQRSGSFHGDLHIGHGYAAALPTPLCPALETRPDNSGRSRPCASAVSAALGPRLN